ncbi:flagellar export chaperone FliS [Azoarcus sp. L1K30]|uniref:Flagellar secretion chaperone FliS n=1 Tax=Parazoarcus communis TaxID=41977 RepID=A0A2U8GRU6_9RHOO|nr:MULTISPECIES: flagellar export chaperone FliS [Zoogloeaceae]AWI75215.1 flagellar export chaperone FliS [Parazoarcus communis]MBR0564542.1 flagellar export chaperone FliS [Azoarcus sp. L1K30]TVT52917.1 MAG: flagellar export chaperone FliS [Azoarcus sp. PHD]|tara:strand:- start:7173 stop:7577 length:405 start_codon:yes stop_codon:yes gene_type:complete
MFGTSYANRASAYARVSTETSVESATPHKLILMLYDGALLSLRTAAAAMRNKDIPTKGAAISKAIDIITNGLKVSLDLEAGGEIAGRLDALYEYMAERLLYANLHNNEAALDEVCGLLGSIREAWEGIANQVTP